MHFVKQSEIYVSTYSYKLHSNEYSHEFYYYPFSDKLDRCVGSCNINELSNKICVPNETENLNLSVLNMITGINESKMLRRHISCECKCRFNEKNVIYMIGEISINVDVSIKNTMYVKNI